GGLAFFDCDLVHLVALANGIDHILARDNLTKDGVLAVKVGLGGVGDEELAAIGVGASIRHRNDARVMLERVAARFVLELVAGAAASGAGGVATLNHEVADYTVEEDAIVEALACQKDEVVDRLGGVRCGQLDDNITARGGD